MLPVVAYDDLDEALAGTSAGDRPLGLCVYSHDTGAVQGALPSMGFGGAAGGGCGHHHGHHGSLGLSDPRGVVVRGGGDLVDAF